MMDQTPDDETLIAAARDVAAHSYSPYSNFPVGAALRFASQGMQDVSRYRKLVLLVTDGAPSDIDVADPEYLVADARRAVQTMRSQGIDAVCVALGPDAGQRQSEIFGRKSCVQITDIATLPSTLSAFYLRMTR